MASLGAPVLPPMPDFSSNDPFSTAGDMKMHLQTLLDSKEKQLQQAGSLGQRVLAQQMELEERIRQLQELEGDKSEEDEIDSDARERYRELADTLLAWDAENAQLSSAFGGSSKRYMNGSHSPDIPYADLPRDEPERVKPSAGSSAAQSRRAKNAAHRADDVEFAFEIGSGLLTEVRRLQSLLGERDKAIQDMKEEKDDLERVVESLRTSIRQNDKLIEELRSSNWDLEVNSRDLQGQVTDSQGTISRLESDHKKLGKSLKNALETEEKQKNELERLQTEMEALKSKHETDVAQARKHAAGLARDKSDLQQTIDTLKAEVARASRRIPRYGSPLTPGGPDQQDFLTPNHDLDGDSDVFGTNGRPSTNRRATDLASLFPPGEPIDYDNSPDPSPIRKPFQAANHPNNEIEALQQRLAHAQRQINTLKGSLNREKQHRIRLEGANGVLPQEEDEEEGEDYVDENTAITENKRPTKRSTTPFKVGRGGRGRGRGRGGVTLIQRLAAASPASEYHDEDEPRLDDSPVPPVPTLPSKYNNQYEEDDEVSQFFGSSHGHGHDVEQEAEEEEPVPRSPSPPAIHSNRTSVDGMDPAFANVLRRVPSNGSAYAGSPLRHSVLNRSGRGGAVVGRRSRGGVPFREARPSSIVDAPEVLAAELSGMDASPFKGGNTSLLNDVDVIEEGEDDGEEYIRVKKVEKIEFGCQTESLEVEDKTAVLPDAVPMVERSDMGIQSEPEPVVVKTTAEMQTQADPVIVEKVTSDVGFQTEPVVVEKAEAATQHQAIYVDNSVGTDPVSTTSVLGKGLPPLVIADSSRRATITQADISRSSSIGDSTLTRSFLAERHHEEEDEEVIDDGEETETGAETDDDYEDARQSINMVTPSEDYHSIMTMTDNEDYDSDEDDDDDAESIKASHYSIRDRSTTSLNRPHTSSSYYSTHQVPETRTLLYESVAVGADLTRPPSPVIVERVVEKIVEKIVEVEKVVEKIVEKPVHIHVPVEVPVQVPVEQPKPEVKEISIQTDAWKPPMSPIVAAPIPKSPTLIRVGSEGHQFRFIPPPSVSSNLNGSPMTSAAPVFIAPSPVPTPKSSVFREPSTGGTFGRRTNVADRRQSIESMISASTGPDESSARSRVPSQTASILLNSSDKSKPPMFSLPPPPKAPPPSIMPPPAFIPERRVASDGPPPRPSSPPPPELIHRATTPLGTLLPVPVGKFVRSQGSSLPPSQTNIRQLSSNGSFRSANGPHLSMHPSSTLSSYNNVQERSTVSLTSDRSLASPRSSISSDRNLPYERAREPTTPEKSADITPRPLSQGQSTDPTVIHAITQTMIGEFMYKYTRQTFGKGVGERRHRRFFWVHPYTKTLYWSSADPGSTNVTESSAKSAYIEGVRSVLDPNPMPPGLYQYSVIVSTPQREMKITAPTKERHDIWLNALKYLLARPSNPNLTSPANNTILPQTPGSATDDERQLVTSPLSQRSTRTALRGETWNTTPRGQRSRSQLSVGGSVGKRSGTPALEYLRWNGPESPYSPDRSFVDVPGHDADELDFELHDESMSDEGYEGLENVRACCDGRHTVGHSGKHHHHHHHHNHQPQGNMGTVNSNMGTINSRRSTENHHLEPHTEPARPASPAWSFRSRAGSTRSGNEGGGLFSWGRDEGGKLRFGSKRSAKSSIQAHD
ncbi:hypothetical protein CPB83DRAFT_791687 [Crepidotus variabilis]|uniref:PH domain-containing protein n=1 Tax=Crepidotus variabilis TaxID=179855 RepID=A0A9P6JPC2_9AGAR|nr:hypothetical protein CPB83DRAFT_791687 [Crepidotus variabilis]